jgi:hypothetical protein
VSFPVSIRFRFFLLLAPSLAIWSGCVSHDSRRAAPVDRAPLSYAIILYLGAGTDLTEEQRTYALSFARDTLLASGLVSPYDRLIDDVERAELLFRARMDDGKLVEIAGVPSVTNSTTVVLSELRRSNDRIWWDTSYPYGPPTYYSGINAGFPIPGPGWGHPRRPRENQDYRDRGDRGNRGDRDRDDRNRGGERGDHRPDPPRQGGDRNGGRDGGSTPPVHRPRPSPPERPRPTYTPPPDRNENTNESRPDPRADRGVIDRAPSRPRQLN